MSTTSKKKLNYTTREMIVINIENLKNIDEIKEVVLEFNKKGYVVSNDPDDVNFDIYKSGYAVWFGKCYDLYDKDVASEDGNDNLECSDTLYAFKVTDVDTLKWLESVKNAKNLTQSEIEKLLGYKINIIEKE